jgi:hypothetical protein
MIEIHYLFALPQVLHLLHQVLLAPKRIIFHQLLQLLPTQLLEVSVVYSYNIFVLNISWWLMGGIRKFINCGQAD